MEISVQARGFSLTKALRDHAERRLRFALGWADARLHRISVRLSDDNGPRGGEDKRCRIRIAFAGAPSVVIEDIETDVYAALDRAADRASRSLARKLERLRDQRRRLSPPSASIESLVWAWR